MTLIILKRETEMDAPRFKIDLYNDQRWPFALYHAVRRNRFLRSPSIEWRMIWMWGTKDEAMKHYEKIKDLPEYLA